MNKQMKKIVTLAMMTVVIFGVTGCSQSHKEVTFVENVAEGIDEKNIPIATIEVEGYGTMTAQLYPHIAPNTVASFISLANQGFYDGLTFHRIVNDFVLQGGDPTGTGTGGPGYTIKGEFAENGDLKNNLSHVEGVLSMARSQAPDSAGSQFFIVTGPATPLDGEYAAFGKIIEGYEIADTLEKVKVGKNDKPVTDVIIKSIRVDTKGVDYKEPEVTK